MSFKPTKFKTNLKCSAATFQPPGGVAKTFTNETLHSIAQVLDRDDCLASKDPGSQALRHQLPTTYSIPGEAQPEDVPRIVNRVKDHEFFFVDHGANPANEHYDPSLFLLALDQQMKFIGVPFFVIVPTVPQKINGDRTAQNVINFLHSEGVALHFLKSHQNRSDDYEEITLPTGVSVSELPHMPSGLVALKKYQGGTIADPYLMPLPGYELAGNHIGEWLSCASGSPMMQAIFGHTGRAFELAPDKKPKEIINPLNKLSDVSNTALERNYVKYRTMMALQSARSADDAAKLKALEEFYQHW